MPRRPSEPTLPLLLVAFSSLSPFSYPNNNPKSAKQRERPEHVGRLKKPVRSPRWSVLDLLHPRQPLALYSYPDDEPKSAPAPAKTAPAAASAPKAPAAPRNVPGAAARGGNQNRPARNAPRRQPSGFDHTPETFDGERVAAPKRAHHGPDKHTKAPGSDFKTSGGHRSRGGHRGAKTPASGGERRQFERKSGTLPDSQKKVDAGWGANEGTAELSAEVQGENDAEAEEKAPETPAEPVEETPAEPEEVQKSLDEYLAERANSAFFGKKEGRQVDADTVEGSQFVREGIDQFFAGKDKKESTKTKARKEKVHIEIDGQFAEPAGSRPARPEGQRGGRGGARGGRGRGEGRGRGAPRGAPRGGANRSNANAANISDDKAFPALGA